MSSHYYDLNGSLVDPWTPGALPSVSTILDRVKSDSYDAMVNRMGQEAADELMATAAARGTRIHKACELYAQEVAEPTGINITADLEDGDLPYVEGFDNWWDRYNPTLIATEKFVHSSKYKYAGRLDLIVELDGQRWIIDIKTGVDSVRHGLQLKMYQQADYEMTGVRARMGVLALDAKRAVGFRNSRSPYGLMEFKEPWSPALAHIAVFKWWAKKLPIKQPKQVKELIWLP